MNREIQLEGTFSQITPLFPGSKSPAHYSSSERTVGRPGLVGRRWILELDSAGQFLHLHSQGFFGSPRTGEADLIDHFRPAGSLRQYLEALPSLTERGLTPVERQY